uniref:Uncharacterized protein n=1 Tax=Caenorhabditis japonica TaxID=281687 RepID=A0A8R1INM2_CAEJA
MESVCIMTATFEFHGSHLHVINVYAPTSAAKESQSDKFYKDLKKLDCLQFDRLVCWKVAHPCDVVRCRAISGQVP